MSVENGKVCCNCRHNIRKREVMFKETFIKCAIMLKETFIKCYCDIDNHYIGYTECMAGWCRHWAKDKEVDK